MKTISDLSMLQGFQCLGSECPEHCCIGWDISVDKNTIDKWNAMEGVDEEYLSKSYIEKPGSDHSSNQSPLKILAKTNSGACVMQGEGGLCDIQKKYGHDFIPETCREYPRKKVKNDSRILVLNSAELSCPEVVNKALFSINDHPLFKKMDLMVKEMSASYNTKDQLYGELARYFLEVLSVNKYPLNLKLYLLSTSIYQLSEKIQTLANDDLWNYILKDLHFKPKDKLFDLNKRNRAGKFQVSKEEYLSFWEAIVKVIQFSDFLNVPDKVKSSKIFTAIGQSDCLDETYNQLKVLFSRVHTQITDHYRVAISRYIMLALINRGYPFSPVGDNPLISFTTGMISFSVVNLFLACMLEDSESFSEMELSQIIWRVERGVGHSTKIFELIKEFPQFLEFEDYGKMFLQLF